MNVWIQLFGAFRQFEPSGLLHLACPDARTVGDVRACLDAYAARHWPEYPPSLLRASAFASSTCVLRDAHAVPHDRQLAILPPVSGG
jgi:hypothetical protein